MAKPMQYVVELSVSEAVRFIHNWLDKPGNPARDAAIKRAISLDIEVR